ncbi:MAG: hypothetical protein ACOVP5_03295 [Chitinophagales bacterium]
MSKKIAFYLRMFMAFCFILASISVLYYRESTHLSDMQTYAFSSLLFVYGVFRVVRAYKTWDDIIVEE